ncbi:hypothetical protein Ndes2526A_g00204 [Nannochloris sp. 'desiccata']|nr:hypothetical protein KSW81_003013 [Chlorella desiccata (nom. nud.)]
MLKSASTKAAKLLALSSKSSHGLEALFTLNTSSGRGIASLSSHIFQERAFGGMHASVSPDTKVPMHHRSFAAQPALCPPEDEVAPGVAAHPGIQSDIQQNNGVGDKCLEFGPVQPHYPSKEYLENIRPQHRQPKTFADYTGYYGVQILRRSFDLVTGYGPNMNSTKWLTRFLFLETVAGVPGMVGGMMRHLRSLRTMNRDKGWIHTLLEEAENERMHLLTFMEMYKPGGFFRTAVIGTQGIFMTLYTLFYAISPRHCHSFVSYLEEEAVKTYTHCINDIDSGKLPEWQNIKVPLISRRYWRLPENASMRDLLLAIRADELCHAHVNTVFAGIGRDDANPFAPGNSNVVA